MQDIRTGSMSRFPIVAELVEEALENWNSSSSGKSAKVCIVDHALTLAAHALSHCTDLYTRAVSENTHNCSDLLSCLMQVQGLAVEGKRHVCGTANHDAAALMRFQRRMSPSCVQLTYMFDGDHHGVVYYLGSKNGQQTFVNPALSGQLQVSVNCRTNNIDEFLRTLHIWRPI